MKEWADPYNSFNSFKGLLYSKWYEAIVEWKEGKRLFPLPPIEVSLDPIHACNLMCQHCNAHRYLSDSSVPNGYRMTDEHIFNLTKFLAEWGVKAICFTGDTKVKLVNGTHKTFEELVEDWNKNKQSFEVYSRDENNNIVSGVAFNPRKTQEVNELIELTLDNNEVVKCTPNHEFMLKDGSYKKAKDLTIEDSLMPLYTRIHYGYEIITDTTYRGTTHKLFSKYYYGNDDKIDSGELHTHHINFNKLDNTRNNLEQLTESKHMQTHILSEERKEKLRKNCFYRTKEGKEISRQRLIAYNKSEKGRKKSGEIFSKYNASKEGKKNSLKQFAIINNKKYNHKIKSKKIIKLNKSISVYCLTVEKYHNFALSSGIFVKNCWGGGGEPTLHTKLKDVLILSKKLGVENSIATNGTLFDDELIKVACETCRWIGVSVDASCKKTYAIGRNKNLFTKTIFNLTKLADYVKRNNLYCDVSFKFLIFDYNQTEIYKACKLAKSLGVKDFHARPADFRHQGLGEWKKKNLGYNIKLIEKQFKQCHELADKDFRVFTVVHKFNDDFTPRRKFNQCYASSICIQLCADGNIYLCPDARHIEYYKLGTHFPNPQNILKIWGNEKHYNLVFKTGCQQCVSRCTFSPYNEQMERLFINKDDPCCKFFV